MPLEIDHLVVCVPDLGSAAADLEESHGVASVEGGRHTGHGTANRLIPLGDSYIELLAVVDPREAQTSVLGSWALQRATRPGADALCLRTDDLDGICARLELQPLEMSRITPAGVALSWRLAGLEQALTRGVPFFIQWQVPSDLHPASLPVRHPAGDVRLSGVTVSGDPAEIREWVGEPHGFEIIQGDPGVSFDLGGSPARTSR